MPVYEFYCADCHTIFNFLARQINTNKRPACPKCRRPNLERLVSPFAVSKGQQEDPSAGLHELDEARLEKAMMGLAGEMEGMDENDPRQMARFMRKFADAAGMDLKGDMDEAIRRLECGEDLEQVEAEMGELFTDDTMENLFTKEGVKGLKRKHTPPAHDDTLYPL